MSLRLISKFASVSRQGLPTLGLRRYGVPPGGALDRESLALANALLGNDPTNPAFEVIGGLSEWYVEEDCTVAVVGAETDFVGAQGSAKLLKGTTLSVHLGPHGFTYYIASTTSPHNPRRLDHTCESPEVLRVVDGPQAHLFGKTWTAERFSVTNQITRAGFRLTGPFDPHNIELTSEPACPGTIQVTPDGNAIILAPDGPTIGGYPKVAIVCSTDLDKLAHLRPGSNLHLERVSLNQARDLLAEHRKRISTRCRQLGIATFGETV
ncbi:MAG: hypothetical protein ACAH95_09350 [Fimbriimonas sp.]